MGQNTLGVVLFQLGGPDSPQAIEPFLFNLFSDPDIIDFPLGKWAREPLARLMASRRARHVEHHYGSIGGRSPIRELTEAQARALEERLDQAVSTRVVVAMRYWHPFTDEAIAEMDRAGAHEIVLLPLYPQYSKTTSGSSFNEWNRKWTPRRGVRVHRIEHYYNHPVYIRSLVEKINDGLQRFGDGDLHLIFSAHGVPVSVIKAGDPYVQHVEETTRLVMEHGDWRHPHAICYQSKVGSGRWVQPSLIGTLRELGAVGVRNVFVAPISFVTDHVETLNEINIEARQEAARVGITGFEMMRGLNDSPTFIAALEDLVLSELRSGGHELLVGTPQQSAL